MRMSKIGRRVILLLIRHTIKADRTCPGVFQRMLPKRKTKPPPPPFWLYEVQPQKGEIGIVIDH